MDNPATNFLIPEKSVIYNVLNDTHLLGLSWDEFQGFTAVPRNGARLCGLLKETPTAQIPLMIFSKG